MKILLLDFSNLALLLHLLLILEQTDKFTSFSKLLVKLIKSLFKLAILFFNSNFELNLFKSVLFICSLFIFILFDIKSLLELRIFLNDLPDVFKKYFLELAIL